jgi:hypothetical protein
MLGDIIADSRATSPGIRKEIALEDEVAAILDLGDGVEA